MLITAYRVIMIYQCIHICYHREKKLFGDRCIVIGDRIQEQLFTYLGFSKICEKNGENLATKFSSLQEVAKIYYLMVNNSPRNLRNYVKCTYISILNILFF